ncbi:MAG TPA: 3-phosphoshikimate 1-carboxyvinyltransferase [Chitinophagaceae bacterium]|jgi:3-phosphoshikimate 1-carboxyvinyltransferase|nr:3-phosphoshikimate 1-carboxyvinyltransferase [Chitinophagaceae bacterium]
MNVTISPSAIQGSLKAPASKSSMQRACAAALVSQTKTHVLNPGSSNDDLAALRVIRSLGAQVESLTDGSLLIESHGIRPVNDFVNCGESGLGIRMFAPLVALSPNTMTIEGEGSLLSRPMDFFDEIFPRLGVEVQSNMGKLPLRLKGPLVPSDIQTDGSLSSQFLTGLLMAYAASDAKDVSIEVTNLKSRPYIDLTLSVMRAFGLKVPENRGYQYFYFSPEPWIKPAAMIEYTVEGDWSGGAFLLVAAAIAGQATVRGLDPGSTQADKAILQALQDAGVPVFTRKNEIQVGNGQPVQLKGFHFDATDCPDLFPPLVALASVCHGSSFLKGVSRLAHKESDRALTLQEEFGKLGVDILINGDVMGIKGGHTLKAGTVHSRHDHRIAMATAVAALRAEGPVQIEKADAINKSYPAFFDDLSGLGASVHVLDKIF